MLSIDSPIEKLNPMRINTTMNSDKNRKKLIQIKFTSQVGFAEFNNTADNRANIGGTIIGAPIVGQ